MLAQTQEILSPRHLEDRHGVRLEVGVWRGQPVLVKTLLSCNAAVTARFRHEASVTAALDSPCVSRLMAVTPNQLIFEHDDGQVLREWLDKPLTPDQSVRVLRGLLAAVEYIHNRGVVHQDIKPENILLRQEASAPCFSQVVLLDYDLSHAAYSLTELEPGLRMGTPHYMAPEQFAGVRGNLRSDLYSVGAVLHDCLTGKPPYEDALGWLTGRIPACQHWATPPAFHPVLGCLLARDPAQRPESASAALHLLPRIEGI